MAGKRGFTPFRSKQEGFDAAHRGWLCTDCKADITVKSKHCPECGSFSLVYFMSKREKLRASQLLMLQSAGTITRLRLQPRFSLDVNGKKLGHYVADADYYEGSEYVVEDTKPEKWQDPFSKWKIRHFQAQYGVQVKIPKEKAERYE